MEEIRVYLEQIGTSSIWENPSVLIVVGALIGIVPSIILRIIDNMHSKKMLKLEYREKNKEIIWIKKEEAYAAIMNYLDEVRVEKKNKNLTESIYQKIKEKYFDKFSQFNIFASEEVNKSFEDKDIFNMEYNLFCDFKDEVYSQIKKDLGICDNLY